MSRRLASGVLLLVLGTGCVSTPNRSAAPGPNPASISKQPAALALPHWVNDPLGHPEFPASKYLTAVGHARVGDDRDGALGEATESGRVRISEQLNSALQGVTEIYMREVGVDQEYSTTIDYAQKVRNETESLFFGSRPEVQFFEPSTDSLYVLVVLHREEHANALLKEVDAALARVTPVAPQATAAGELRALVEEHAALESIMPSLFTLDLVVPRNLALRAQFDQRFSSAKARIQKVLAAYRDAEVSVKLVSGSGQAAHANGELPQPLVFEATFGGRPLAGFPVAFTLEHPEAAEIVAASKQTEPDGRFSCRIAGLRLTGQEENEVHGSLDFASLGQKVLEAPSAPGYFVLPTLQSSNFSIAIQEFNLEKQQSQSAVAGRIQEALAKRRARMTDLDAFLTPSELGQVATASTGWLRERLAGHVDYLVRGTTRSEFSSILNGTHFCYAGGTIELIDVRTGELLDVLESPVSNTAPKSGSSSKEKAGIGALKKLAILAEETIIGKIDAVFGIEGN